MSVLLITPQGPHEEEMSGVGKCLSLMLRLYWVIGGIYIICYAVRTTTEYRISFNWMLILCSMLILLLVIYAAWALIYDLLHLGRKIINRVAPVLGDNKEPRDSLWALIYDLLHLGRKIMNRVAPVLGDNKESYDSPAKPSSDEHQIQVQEVVKTHEVFVALPEF